MNSSNFTQTTVQTRQAEARQWFEKLADLICNEFEALEKELPATFKELTIAQKFTRIRTTRNAPPGTDLGGGVMAKMIDGRVFEKVGVNVSTVYGPISSRMSQALMERQASRLNEGDQEFWASGISLVAHMGNPRVPAIHFNTRMFTTNSGWWFGGGTDLNPCIERQEDTDQFHAGLKQVCRQHSSELYPQLKRWADEYFFLPHRGRARGVGGIFFDDFNTGDWDKDFAFVRKVGQFFLDFYLSLVKIRQLEQWTHKERELLLMHRGLYAEFNLIYDRGTKFGLETGHNPDAVLMSLPPVAKWR